MADPWSLVAEAVEKRRKELGGLSWRQVQERGGPSAATMQALVNRYEPIVTERKRAALCQALDWPADHIDRMLTGAAPVEAEARTLDERFAQVAVALEALREIQAGQSRVIQGQSQVIRALVDELRSQRGLPSDRRRSPRAG